MKFRSVVLGVEDGVKSLSRNRLMSVSSVLTVASCVFILIFSYCIAANLDFILMKLENTGGITIIIDDAVSGPDVNVLYSQLTEIEFVADVKFVSAEEALDTFSKGLGQDSTIYEDFIKDNPIRRRFTVELTSTRHLGEVLAKLEEMKKSNVGIAAVNHAKQIADTLITVNNVVRIVSIVIVLVLGALSIVIIINTIKLTVNSRRHEINIMKYVGATNAFIKVPFVVEGIVIGLLGSIVPLTILIFTYRMIVESLQKNTAVLQELIQFRQPGEIFPYLSPMILVLGILIGTIGSLVSIRKHLNV